MSFENSEKCAYARSVITKDHCPYLCMLINIFTYVLNYIRITNCNSEKNISVIHSGELLNMITHICRN